MVNSTAPTVLDRLTEAIRSTQGPIRLEALARRIGVQASALSGMLGTLERKGVLTMPAEPGSDDGFACSAACGRSCAGLDACPFIADVREPQPIVILRGDG
jgi:hypothetical protein